MRITLAALALVFGALTFSSAQSGVAGDWAVTFNSPQGARDATMTMKVDGTAVTGSIASEIGDIPVKGTAKGNTFNLTMDVQTPNGNLSISMTGEVTGDSIKGTLDFGQGTGDFTGKRKN
jgi:hypothetical protein